MVIYEKSKYFSTEAEGNDCPGLSPFTVRALRARGAVTDKEIDAFLHPTQAQLYDPFLFNDMEKAVARIKNALENGEKICVFGDYDVDGICATAMLTDYFRSVGADVCFHIPSRRDEGYGITKSAVAKLKADGVRLIVTVDNGISAASEIAYCREIGLDVIVTDHHLPPAELPVCCCIICHTLKDSRYPDNILCGAGITFKLIQALAGNKTAMKYVSLAALATVADVVPLVGENRVLTYFGLEAANSGDCCLGLKRLLGNIPTVRKPYNSFTFGFAAAPRLNASGRMKDASLAAELFLSGDEVRIAEIIIELNELNELRQREEMNIFNDAAERLKTRDIAEERALILSSPDWHPGVIGIAASRISEMYHRPTILFSESEGFLKGSGRSVGGVNLYAALEANKRFLLRYGGHAKAAGLTMKAGGLDEFRRSFNEYLKNTYDDESFAPRQYYEFEAEFSDITAELVSELSCLAPFGEGNPFPVFRTKDVRASRVRRFGTEGRHIRMDFEKAGKAFEAIWFSASGYFENVINAESADILYTVDVNCWNGIEKLQLRLNCVNAENPKNPESYVEYRLPQFLSAFIENCSCPENTEKIDETPVEIPEKTEADIKIFGKEYLSGTLILVNTPAAAVKLLTDIRENEIKNIDVCTGTVPESRLPCTVILLAPLMSELPEHGFAKVLCYDIPPVPENFRLIKKRLPNARLLVNSEASGDYTALITRLDCSRMLFSGCYRAMYSLLSKRGYSFNELVKRLKQDVDIIKAQAEFAVRVFLELRFIKECETGSLVIEPDLRENPLSNSVLYRRVCTFKNKYANC